MTILKAILEGEFELTVDTETGKATIIDHKSPDEAVIHLVDPLALLALSTALVRFGQKVRLDSGIDFEWVDENTLHIHRPGDVT